MPIDPTIALRLKPLEVPSPMESAAKMYSLRNLMNQGDLQKLQVEQATLSSKKRQALTEAIANMTAEQANDPAFIRKLMLEHAEPSDLAKYLAEERAANKPIAIGSGGLRLPGGEIIPPAARPQVAQQPSSLARLLAERDALPQGDPRRAIYDQGITHTINPQQQRIIIPPQPPAVTPVTIQDPNNPNETIVIDGRTKQVLGKGPKLTQMGAMQQKRALVMEGLGADLQQAEDLLMGQKRDYEGNITPSPLPTGSGIGSVLDTAASWIGVSPQGAAEADALKVVAGRLIQKIPRFEGPQSDKDVLLYRQSAADAGNEKLPRGRRLLALRKMREIYSRYETGVSGTIAGERRAPTTPPSGNAGQQGGIKFLGFE